LTPFEAILLGLLQGITEFLPISSSGHLVIAQHFIEGFDQPGVLFDVMLHFGTLVAVVVYFWKEVSAILGCLSFRATTDNSDSRKLILLIIAGTLPTVVIALSFKDIFEKLFTSLPTVGFMLIVTGTLLYLTKSIKNPSRGEKHLSVIDAVIIGFVQGIAIIPGISRSGSTIAAGIFRGIDPVVAARFSFLLSIPAILGATILEARGFNELTLSGMGTYMLGAFVAGVSGFLAIAALMKILMNGHLRLFSYYCWIVGGVILFFLK
jgi:undecaprenyl-diphosphatase